jgi:hypothetical protein
MPSPPSFTTSTHTRALRLVSRCCLLLSMLALAGVAEAQSFAAGDVSARQLSNPRPRSSAFELSSPTRGSRGEAEPRDDAPDEADDALGSPMNGAGLGVKLGIAGTGEGSASIRGYEGRTEKRVGLHVSVPIFLGGDGFGFLFEPMLQKSQVPHSLKDSLGNVIGTEDVGVVGLGVYLGPQVQIRASERAYIGFGIGPKVLYLSNDAFQYAWDVYGRVPLSTTVYVNRHVALLAELGLGYGFSVFTDAPQPVVDVEGRTVRNMKDDPQFGSAFAWDLSFGVRVP